MAIAQSAMKDYAWYFVGNLLPRLLTLAALSIYTHHIDPVAYGSYALCLAWVSLAVTILLYWIQSAIQRLHPEYARDGLVGVLFGSTIVASLVLIATALPLMWLAGRSVDPSLALGTAAAFAGQGLSLLVTAVATAARDRRRFAVYAVIDGMIKFGLGLVVVVRGLGIGWLLTLPAASGILLFAFDSVRLARSGLLSLRLDRTVVRSMSRYGLPLVLVWVGALLLANLDRFMLAWLGSPFILGIYAAAYPLGDAAVQVFATPMLVTLSARLYARAAKDGVEAARGELARAVTLVSAPLGLVVALSMACAESIVVIFLGPAYESAASVLPLVSGGLVFWALGSLLAKEFELEKNTHASWPPVIGATIVNGLLNLVAIPRWGALGAAAATLLAYFAYFLIVGALSKTSAILVLGRAWRPLLAAPLSGLLTHVYVHPAWRPVFTLGIRATVVAACYVVLLVVLRDPQVIAILASVGRRAAADRAH